MYHLKHFIVQIWMNMIRINGFIEGKGFLDIGGVIDIYSHNYFDRRYNRYGIDKSFVVNKRFNCYVLSQPGCIDFNRLSVKINYRMYLIDTIGIFIHKQRQIKAYYCHI